MKKSTRRTGRSRTGSFVVVIAQHNMTACCFCLCVCHWRGVIPPPNLHNGVENYYFGGHLEGKGHELVVEGKQDSCRSVPSFIQQCGEYGDRADLLFPMN